MNAYNCCHKFTANVTLFYNFTYKFYRFSTISTHFYLKLLNSVDYTKEFFVRKKTPTKGAATLSMMTSSITTLRMIIKM